MEVQAQNVLNINYGINLEAFSSISYDNSSIYSFVDSAGGTMNFQSIETLNVNSVAWTNLVGSGTDDYKTLRQINDTNTYNGVFSSPAAGKIVLFDWDSLALLTLLIYLYILKILLDTLFLLVAVLT